MNAMNKVVSYLMLSAVFISVARLNAMAQTTPDAIDRSGSNSNYSCDTASIYLNGRKILHWDGSGSASCRKDRRDCDWRRYATARNVYPWQGGAATGGGEVCFPYFGAITETILLAKHGNTTVNAAGITPNVPSPPANGMTAGSDQTVGCSAARSDSTVPDAASANPAAIPVADDFNPGAITPASPDPICHSAEAPQLTMSNPSGGSGNYSWKWQEKTAGNEDWSDIPDNDGQPSYSPGILTATKRYRVLVTDSGASDSCRQQPANEVEITVHPVPTVNSISDQTVCNGSQTTEVKFATDITPPSSVTYEWENINTTVGLWASKGTGDIASFKAENNTGGLKTALITVTPKIGTCGGDSRTFSITVLPAPAVESIHNQTVCDRVQTAAVNFTAAIDDENITVDYEWARIGDNIGLSDASGSGDFPSFTAANSTGMTVSNTVIVTPKITSGGVTCACAPRNFTIMVNPKPLIRSKSAEIYSGASFYVYSIDHVSGDFIPYGGNMTYTWSVPSHSFVNGMSNKLNQENISDGPLTNLSTSEQTVTYEVTPNVTLNGITCASSPFDVYVKVKAQPAAGTLSYKN
jgi:hypothetical protein